MHSPGRRAVLGQADQKEGGIALISLVELRYQFLAKVVMGNGRISQVRQPENRRYTVYPRKLVLEGKRGPVRLAPDHHRRSLCIPRLAVKHFISAH